MIQVSHIKHLEAQRLSLPDTILEERLDDELAVSEMEVVPGIGTTSALTAPHGLLGDGLCAVLVQIPVPVVLGGELVVQLLVVAEAVDPAAVNGVEDATPAARAFRVVDAVAVAGVISESVAGHMEELASAPRIGVLVLMRGMVMVMFRLGTLVRLFLRLRLFVRLLVLRHFVRTLSVAVTSGWRMRVLCSAAACSAAAAAVQRL